jgi:hypothetical protein
MSTQENVQTVKDFFAANRPGRQGGSAGARRRRHRVDHSGQGLAAGRNAPRARWSGGCISEGF